MPNTKETTLALQHVRLCSAEVRIHKEEIELRCRRDQNWNLKSALKIFKR